MFGLSTVVKSDILILVISILSLDIPSSESMAISQIGNNCFLVPFTVTRCLVSCRTGLRFNLLTASFDMKSLPAPVAKWAQNVCP